MGGYHKVSETVLGIALVYMWIVLQECVCCKLSPECGNGTFWGQEIEPGASCMVFVLVFYLAALPVPTEAFQRKDLEQWGHWGHCPERD